ncbi:MAG: hypothetical protein GY951_15440 [Psychromonas sp.]|nr:hypothetical protein [Psychromonas sp.]
MPLLAVGIALYANEHKIGLFNQLDLPYLLVFTLSLLLLDLLIIKSGTSKSGTSTDFIF